MSRWRWRRKKAPESQPSEEQPQQVAEPAPMQPVAAGAQDVSLAIAKRIANEKAIEKMDQAAEAGAEPIDVLLAGIDAAIDAIDPETVGSAAALMASMDPIVLETARKAAKAAAGRAAKASLGSVSPSDAAELAEEFGKDPDAVAAGFGLGLSMLNGVEAAIDRYIEVLRMSGDAFEDHVRKVIEDSEKDSD